jgi:hypothetical protein
VHLTSPRLHPTPMKKGARDGNASRASRSTLRWQTELETLSRSLVRLFFLYFKLCLLFLFFSCYCNNFYITVIWISGTAPSTGLHIQPLHTVPRKLTTQGLERSRHAWYVFFGSFLTLLIFIYVQLNRTTHTTTTVARNDDEGAQGADASWLLSLWYVFLSFVLLY